MGRKKDPYKGTILGVPVKSELPLGVKADKPLFEEWRERWAKEVQRMERDDMVRVFETYAAVYAHFGIVPRAPLADQELVLSIACRHEEDLIDAQGHVQILKLFTKYEVEPDDEAGFTKLAWKIIRTHIPAFKPRDIEQEFANRWQGLGGSPLNLDTPKTILFMSATGTMAKALVERHGKYPSTRQLAKYLSNEKEAAKIVGSDIAIEILRPLKGLGNSSRGNPRDLSERAIRSFIAQIKNAPDDLKNGKATKFQIQFLTEVLPFVLEHGQ